MEFPATLPQKAPASSPVLASGERERFCAELEQWQMAPLWNVYRSVLSREPREREVPFLWRWKMVRPRLLRAGELITAEEAERRVLMFLNPGNTARIGATATLYAAAQLILPGECARAHRHSPAALRFIIEGSGAFTCVQGEKITMVPGDMILTPSMLWHDHGNEGSEPVMWLDGLDIPLAVALNCMFLEEFAGLRQAPRAAPQQPENLNWQALFPSGPASAGANPCSPVWTYRWENAREALEKLARGGSEPDPFHAYTLRYANPDSGGEVMPTMGCRLHLLRRGQHTKAHRHTPSTVYHVAEGSGFSVLNGTRLDWEKGDTFAVPIWCWHEHAAPAEDAVLFAFTDEPVLRILGLDRGERYAENGGFQRVGGAPAS